MDLKFMICYRLCFEKWHAFLAIVFIFFLSMNRRSLTRLPKHCCSLLHLDVFPILLLKISDRKWLLAVRNWQWERDLNNYECILHHHWDAYNSSQYHKCPYQWIQSFSFVHLQNYKQIISHFAKRSQNLLKVTKRKSCLPSLWAPKSDFGNWLYETIVITTKFMIFRKFFEGP